MKGQIRKTGGFSLIELVIVIVIIGIIGAIAIPRMSRGAEGAADGALKANLAVLRNALDLYAAEHGGKYPPATDTADYLTSKTNAAGTLDTGMGTDFIFGPYLRAVPPLPVGANKGAVGIAASAAEGIGWVYDSTTGEIEPNTGTEKDAAGKLYTEY